MEYNMINSNQGKLFGKKTRQVDQVVLTVPAVTQGLALVVNVETLCVCSFYPPYQHHDSHHSSFFGLQILTVIAPLDVDQILVIRADK